LIGDGFNSGRCDDVDSFHSFQQKNASFDSMAHRLTNIPMSTENYNVKREFILDLGRKNVYQDHTIERIIKKHEVNDVSNLTKLRIRRFASCFFIILSIV
jgi:hypothetical protein